MPYSLFFYVPYSFFFYVPYSLICAIFGLIRAYSLFLYVPCLLDSGWCDAKGSAVQYFFFFVTLVTGPRRSLNLKLSDTGVYEPHIRARLVTTAHFCEVRGTPVVTLGQGRHRVLLRGEVFIAAQAVGRRAAAVGLGLGFRVFASHLQCQAWGLWLRVSG